MEERRRVMRDQREFERAKPFMLYGVLFSLPGVYRTCRFVIAERRELRQTRSALEIIREDTARRLAAENHAAHQVATELA
ncbi:hypothetical protein [Arthrobacter sp. B0490]|uniref:hypothetical protein n=1 Tax=Arthrobacter sp. B0490 TaxID=2058891 RepID=UPI0011AFE004|nr:hypothetical protein [Arthrobacter sp. B0490]